MSPQGGNPNFEGIKTKFSELGILNINGAPLRQKSLKRIITKFPSKLISPDIDIDPFLNSLSNETYAAMGNILRLFQYGYSREQKENPHISLDIPFLSNFIVHIEQNPSMGKLVERIRDVDIDLYAYSPDIESPSSVVHGVNIEGSLASKQQADVKLSPDALFVHKISLDLSGSLKYTSLKEYQNGSLKSERIHQKVINKRKRKVLKKVEAFGIRDFVLVEVDDSKLESYVMGKSKNLKGKCTYDIRYSGSMDFYFISPQSGSSKFRGAKTGFSELGVLKVDGVPLRQRSLSRIIEKFPNKLVSPKSDVGPFLESLSNETFAAIRVFFDSFQNSYSEDQFNRPLISFSVPFLSGHLIQINQEVLKKKLLKKNKKRNLKELCISFMKKHF